MASDIPDIPQSVDGAVRKPLSKLREAVQVLLGFRGAPEDAALTLRKMVTLGFAKQVSSTPGGTVGYVPVGGTGGGAGGDTEPDLTPPPNVPDFTASAGLTQIFVEWPAATYTQGHGHKQTNIYAVKKAPGDATVPTFTEATRVFSATGALTVASLPSDLSTRWHIWLKYETNDGVESSAPAGGTNGKVAQTGKIGNTDLGPLIVEAQNLANSAIPTKLGAGIFETFTVYGTGLNGTNPGPGEFFRNNVQQGTTVDRGFTVKVFNRGTHALLDTRHYDTYADRTSNSLASNNAMAAFLNSLGEDRVVMVASYDACSFDSTGNVLRAALKRVGASVAIDGAFGADRYQYALAGIPGLGQGNGVEVLKGPAPGVPKAEAIGFWVDSSLVGSGSTINGYTLLTGDYFVDGAVQARHLAAGSIAVGTAAIAMGAILNAMIADATIDNAKIANVSASKLTAGRIAVGEYIASTNYNEGLSGWVIWGNGNAEFNNITVRNSTYTGTVYAGAGTIGGIRINAFQFNNDGYVPGTSGFALFSNGGAEFNSGATFRGTLDVGGNSGQRANITNSGVRLFNSSNVEVITLAIA